MYESSIGVLDFMIPIFLTMAIPLMIRLIWKKKFDVEKKPGLYMIACWFFCYLFYAVSCWLAESTDLLTRMIFFYIGTIFYSAALYVTVRGINVEKRQWHILLMLGENEVNQATMTVVPLDVEKGLPPESIITGQIVGKALRDDDDFPQRGTIVTGQAVVMGKGQREENGKPDKKDGKWMEGMGGLEIEETSK